MAVFPEFNFERLRPYLRSPARLGGDADVGPPPPDGVPEHEVQELLKFQVCYGRPYVLVRWTGLQDIIRSCHEQDNIQSFRCKARPLRPRKRPQRSISRTFYANSRWLRRPGPWPGAGAVTACQ